MRRFSSPLLMGLPQRVSIAMLAIGVLWLVVLLAVQ